jgi:hypothetical protein
MAWMVERHDKADFILGVVSDKWLRAAYSKVERMAGGGGGGEETPGLHALCRRSARRTADHRRPSQASRNFWGRAALRRKTVLAAAYAERYRGDYRATWWIRAQTESSMRADLVALGVRLGWVAAEDKEEPGAGSPSRSKSASGPGRSAPSI